MRESATLAPPRSTRGTGSRGIEASPLHKP